MIWDLMIWLISSAFMGMVEASPWFPGAFLEKVRGKADGTRSQD
jgi:hypothetical protein